MTDQFLGEVRIVGFNFAPRGWALCNGQLLAISQNTALFSLLGTTYGGNGTSNFALPNFQGNVPIHAGQGPGLSTYAEGETAGSISVTMLQPEMPAHSHTLMAGQLSVANPAQNVAAPTPSAFLGLSTPGAAYTTLAASNTSLAPSAIGLAGGNLPHPNQQPFLVMNFVIAIAGVFPARN